MTEQNSNSNNDKVTLSVLGYRMNLLENKIDNIEKKLDIFLEAQHKQDNSIVSLLNHCNTDHEEIEKLRSTSRNWDIITGIGAALAAILGALGFKN